MFGLVSGIRFVLDKVGQAVDAEVGTGERAEENVRDELLRLQLELEEGRIGEAEFAARERALFDRLHELRRIRGVEEPAAGGVLRVESVEADAGEAPPRRGAR